MRNSLAQLYLILPKNWPKLRSLIGSAKMWHGLVREYFALLQNEIFQQIFRLLVKTWLQWKKPVCTSTNTTFICLKH